MIYYEHCKSFNKVPYFNSEVYIKTNGYCSLDIEAQSVFNSLSAITESKNTKGSCLFFSYGKK